MYVQYSGPSVRHDILSSSLFCQVGVPGFALRVSPSPLAAWVTNTADADIIKCWVPVVPPAFALLWPSDEVSCLATWLWVTEALRVCVCVSERVWMCMLQIDLPLVCHIKLALHWPPSCLQAAPYITQLSVALGEPHSGLDRKVNNYNSWAMFYIPLAK